MTTPAPTSANLAALAEATVVCPHCWHGFYPDQAWYISGHAELVGDAVAGDFEQARFAPHQATRDGHGHAVDPKGARMVDRACPRCHLQVPRDLLRQRPLFVSVVGAPRSGKTYFVTAMVHQARRELGRFFHYALHEADSHDVRAFQQLEQALFYNPTPDVPTFLAKTEESGSPYNRVRLDGGDVLLPKPFIFSLRPTDANVDAAKHGAALHRELVLYDNAGESFEHLKERYGERVTQHLGEAAAVLFTFDPLQDPDARQRLAGGGTSADPQLTTAAHSYRQDPVLTETVHRIRRHRQVPDGTRLPVDLAVCVMKYDVWRPLLPFGADDIDHTSVEADPTAPVGRFDVDEVNRISLLARAFVDEVSPAFVATAEANFRTVRYFPVSALGGSPAYDDQATAGPNNPLKVRPSAVQPFRASHPLLWVIQRQGLIRKTHADPAAAAALPQAVVQQTAGDRTWVVLPGSRQTLVLDAEYAGRWIVDPHTGQRVGIPGKPAAPPPKPPSPVASAADAPAPKLPDAAPRRGWFRRS